jgi:excisionase family DNA binding protein
MFSVKANIDSSDIDNAYEKAKGLNALLKENVELMKIMSELSSGAETDKGIEEDLTVARAAAALSISKNTIYREIEDGKLHAHRVGRQGLRIKPEEIERYRRDNSVRKGA